MPPSVCELRKTKSTLRISFEKFSLKENFQFCFVWVSWHLHFPFTQLVFSLFSNYICKMIPRSQLLKEIVQKKKLDVSPEHRKDYTFFNQTVTLQEDPQGGVGGSLWESVSLLHYITITSHQLALMEG
jgi:hypothetical protein